MLNSKKISKLPKKPSPTYTKLPQLPSNLDESKKVTRCRFKQIPQNSKYIHLNPVYPVCGDMPLMQFQDGLTTEISLFNESKTYRDMVVKEMYDQKVLAVRPIPKKNSEFLSQSEILEKLSHLDTMEIADWAKVLKVFYQKYDKVMKRQTRKKTKSDTRKKFYVQVTSKTEQTKKDLYASYPCYEIKFRIKNHHSQLNEILFNENFLKEIGYSTDSFVSTILKEGIPQLMSYDSSNSFSIKSLIENYFQIEDSGFLIPDLESTLLLKNGFVKKIKYQMHILMNYEANTFGMDIVWSILSKEEPYLTQEKNLLDKINECFIQEMAVRENEADHFLSVFYNQSIQKRYTNINKICTIKELNSS